MLRPRGNCIAAAAAAHQALTSSGKPSPWVELYGTCRCGEFVEYWIKFCDGVATESRIGGQWLNRVGIVAVLIGVSYFLKYAFDAAWIGPAGRVLIGLAGGLATVFWSEYIRRTGYDIFSSSLKAVGIGVLYLSLWA